MTRLTSLRTALGRPIKAARGLTTVLTIAAVTAGSTLTFAAPPLPQRDAAQPAIVKVNDHHKNAQKNWNRPPAAQYQRRKKNNNEAVAIGVGIAAVIGALALSQQANSSEGRGMRQECRRLRWKCRDGRGWACRKFDDMCR